MSASTPPPPDARWRPLALLIPVGALCTLVAGLCPDEGWTVAGRTVRVELPANQPIVLLREKTGERYLPIWIGAPEATAIAFALRNPTMADGTRAILRELSG